MFYGKNAILVNPNLGHREIQALLPRNFKPCCRTCAVSQRSPTTLIRCGKSIYSGKYGGTKNFCLLTVKNRMRVAT